jgi:hypothetical protein
VDTSRHRSFCWRAATTSYCARSLGIAEDLVCLVQAAKVFDVSGVFVVGVILLREKAVQRGEPSRAQRSD